MAGNEIAELTKKVGELSTQMKSLTDRPDLSGLRVDSEGRPTSYWDNDDAESVNLVQTPGHVDGSQAKRLGIRRNRLKALTKHGYQPWGGFKSAADFFRAGFEHGHSSEKMRSLHEGHFKAVKAIQGMSEFVGSDGGLLVMPEFSNAIFDRTYANDLWGRTDSYTVAGNSMTFHANAETSRANGSRHGGLRGYWVNEGGTISSSKPTFRELQLKLRKLAVVVYLTEELLADTAYALEQYVVKKVSEEFNFMIGDALINANGVGQPLGILNSLCLLSIAAEVGQAAGTIVPENIDKMYSRFFAPNLPNAIWLHNQDIMPALNAMTIDSGTAGQLVFTPPTGLSGAPYGTLRGRPMVPTEFNETLGTQGDLLLADLGQMVSISKGGIAQAVSMHVEFLTDQTALRFTMRLDAQPWENSPITPYKGSNTQSSFIALDSRL